MEAFVAFAALAAFVLIVAVLASKGGNPPPFLGSAEDIVLGTTTPPVSIPMTELRLGRREQSYHAAIFGRSGSGKSRLLESIFLQHLNKGHGVGMVEPHHDLSFDTLTYLVDRGFFKDEAAFKRVIYIDWGNGDYVPFNVLAYDRPAHTVALNALDAMLRVWPELAEAPMFQTLFLSGVMALIANRLPITFLYQLITEKPFRDACLRKVKDPLVHQTFENFDKLGRDQPQAAGSLLRRCFLLAFSPLARMTLGQPDNVLDFRKIMDEGSSIIVNLGNIGDQETRQLIGAMVLVQIEQAALSRTDLLPSQRTPFTLLVDEWPAFAAQEKTISHILSQARKYNLRLYLSAQSLAQVDSTRLVGALENCKLHVSFALGRDSAVTQSRHIASIDPMMVKEAAMTPTQHNQYVSVLDQFEMWTQELQNNLGPRDAYVKLEGKEAVRIKTIGMPDAEPDPEELARVLSTYRSLYQRSPDEAERAIASIELPTAKSANGQATPSYARVYESPQERGDLAN